MRNNDITGELASKEEKLLKILRSLAADVSAMKMPLSLGEYADEDIDPDAFFGPFVEYYDEAEEVMVESAAGVRIHWPNLSILLREAEILLHDVDHPNSFGEKEVSEQ